MSDFSIPIHVEERHGLRREGEAIRIGVPLPRGLIYGPAEIVVSHSTGAVLPHQAAPLARWPDRSIKWLLVDASARLEPRERSVLFVRPKGSAPLTEREAGPRLQVEQRDGVLEIDTGTARFEMVAKGLELFAAVTIATRSVLSDPGSRIRLIDRDNETYEADMEQLVVEEQGPFRATIVGEGRFRGARGTPPLRFTSRAVFVAGSTSVCLDFQVWNPQPAVHPDGLWDLGDPGSWFFEDLSLCFYPRSSADALRWYAESPADEREHANGPWSIYQDSSGGEHWDSPNHIDQRSQSTVVFRGYRVRGGSAGKDAVIAEGQRASPAVTVASDEVWIAAGTKDFWQDFPKALRWHNGILSVGLFPTEAHGCFELQGGEQKRHTVFLDFGLLSHRPRIAELQRPVAVWVDPEWIETSHAIAWFVNEANDDNKRYVTYVNQIIDGPHSFFAKRETIDEYGWRNFGDLYADHEAVDHRGPQPFISHYNNQYDFIYGAFLHFQRTGDARWRQLMEDAVRHTIDIDIYHTQGDKAAFNGGLFWHTDHYKAAATCTHRTYSRRNGCAGYGGGPSNEHNYTSGLLHYYYLSGDAEAADTVLSLANWVIAMDDGSRNLFGLVDTGPTGFASKTVSPDYHGPGRGAGNSINALLDAYQLSTDRDYMRAAEDLIQRCIHPADDIGALKLDEVEYRWSYLVFLQVLGKYLHLKAELQEFDYYFGYARVSLLHYAGWMLANEVPYKEVLHKVEIPTETWPAHDIRKCHVLYLAALYADDHHRAAFRKRAAFFFERCMQDLLGFETAYLTRPLVILCVYGYIHAYFQGHEDGTQVAASHAYAFGEPRGFRPQRARIREALVRKLHLVATEIKRLLRDRVARR